MEIQTDFLYFAEANRVYATTRRFKFPTEEEGKKEGKLLSIVRKRDDR